MVHDEHRLDVECAIPECLEDYVEGELELKQSPLDLKVDWVLHDLSPPQKTN